ncbi:MAG: SIMPL domain-containing protein [Candidatus Paceibacterota bacterium]|jgi:hypothetical protein
MNDNIKKYFWAAVGVSVLLLGSSAWRFASSYSESIQPSSFRSFSVNAEGKSISIPDIAAFTFSVLTQGDKNLANIQKENSNKMNKAISFVKENGVQDKDIKTQNYNLQPRYQYFSCPKDGGACPPPQIVGYEITQTVLVKVRDFAKVGDILAGVVNNGANTVSDFQFTIDDQTAAQDVARAEAIQKAKVKAQSIAKAGGFSLGRLLGISESGNYPRPMMYNYATKGMGGDAEMSSAPSIEPGSQETTVNVTLQYEIR